MTRRAGAWIVEARRGGAGRLWEPWPDATDQGERRIACCDVTGAALVLGSAQSESAVDRDELERRSMALVRRPSGGGAVAVSPGAQLWLDAWVPRGDPLHDDDVVRGAWWMGEWWAGALTSCGVSQIAVHRGRSMPARSPVCFGGIGPGEVTVRDLKLVGLAQRRSRAGTRLTSMAHVHFDPRPTSALLGVEDGALGAAVTDLSTLGLDPRVLVDTLLRLDP
ncbi:MAG: lipoyl protein ligase domain-containing protein [Acidimicrobiales bacterium]